MDGNDKIIVFTDVMKLDLLNKMRKTISRYHDGQNKTLHRHVYLQTVYPPSCSRPLFFQQHLIGWAFPSSRQSRLSHVNVWSRISLHIALEFNINILLFCYFVVFLNESAFTLSYFKKNGQRNDKLEGGKIALVCFSQCKETHMMLYSIMAANMMVKYWDI